MNHPSTSVTSSSNEPLHRRPPTSLKPSNKYLYTIQGMRNNVREFIGLDGGNHGPISHALQNIRDFACSASGWTQEHLTRFQIIILPGQLPDDMFPSEYVPSADDKTHTSIQAEGFFIPTKIDVAYGRWAPKMYNHFFIDLMQLLRGGTRTPTPHTSLKLRESYVRGAKLDAKAAIKAMISISPTSLGRSDITFSQRSASSMESNSVVNLGNRETSTYSLMHNFLKYIATMEHHAWPDSRLWCPR